MVTSGLIIPPPLPPQTVFVGGYTSRCLSVRVRNVLFPQYLEESLTEFHQILHTHSYLEDKYY